MYITTILLCVNHVVLDLILNCTLSVHCQMRNLYSVVKHLSLDLANNVCPDQTSQYVADQSLHCFLYLFYASCLMCIFM